MTLCRRNKHLLLGLLTVYLISRWRLLVLFMIRIPTGLIKINTIQVALSILMDTAGIMDTVTEETEVIIREKGMNRSS